MNLLERLHASYVAGRRAQVLATHVAELIPQAADVLDVGCGNGQLATLILQRRPDLTLEGVDILAQAKASIPVRVFDGKILPFADASFDTVLLVDTLHHAGDRLQLLGEASRVARRSLIIKDHVREGLFAEQTLRFMDWVGNARFSINLPYNYWTNQQWKDAFESFGLKIALWETTLGLYPFPAGLLFERSLHFLTRLDKPR